MFKQELRVEHSLSKTVFSRIIHRTKFPFVVRD